MMRFKKSNFISFFITFIIFIQIYSIIIPNRIHKGSASYKIEVFQNNGTVPIQTNIYKIVCIRSGLGNQLFQYAFAYTLREETGYPVFIDLHYFKECHDNDCLNLSNTYKGEYSFRKCNIRFFNLSLKPATMEQITYTEILQEDEIYNHKLSDFKTPVNQYFSGYFEDLRYYNFSKYKKDLMKEFTLKVELPSLHKKYLKMIKSTNSVSVHIRRTDHGSLGFVPLQYYIDSINYMKQHVENPHFFIFSDDLDFFRKNIKIEGNYTLIEGTNTSNPIFDFELMRNCKHNIIANSTFSWWAALLNAFKKKIVTAPKLWRSDKPSDYIIPEDYIVF